MSNNKKDQLEAKVCLEIQQQINRKWQDISQINDGIFELKSKIE